MTAAADLDEYVDELHKQVCSRCISRQRGAPPCAPLGVDCGVEQHVETLVEICRTLDSPLIDPYLVRLRDETCAECEYQDRPVCPCPLKYLLPLAVDAVEAVEDRRRLLANLLALPDEEFPETD